VKYITGDSKYVSLRALLKPHAKWIYSIFLTIHISVPVFTSIVLIVRQLSIRAKWQIEDVPQGTID
jgi:hypothetical protein